MRKLLTILVLLGFLAVPPCGWAGVVSFFIPGDPSGTIWYEVDYRTSLTEGHWTPYNLVSVPAEGRWIELPANDDQGFYRFESLGPPPPPPGG